MIQEETVTKSGEYAESIINTVREPLITLDQDLRVVTASRSFYDVFKVKPEETVGQLIYDLGNKQWDIPKLRELLETILPEKSSFDNYEVEHEFADIGRRTMLLNARQIQRAQGKERIILLAIEDITARREIENGLENARKELAETKIAEDAAREYAESLINTVREPLITLDQDLRVVTASRSFYEVFKVKPEETVRQLIYDLGNKQWDIPKLRELLETILPEKSSFDNYEVEHEFASIGLRTMLLNARQIQRSRGKERVILLAIEDITERKKIEEKLNRVNTDLEMMVKELASANRELEAFSYSVAHDLRAPLRGIAGFSQAVIEDCGPSLDKQGREYLDRILAATVRMGAIIDALLGLANIGRKAMFRASVDLSGLAQEMLSEFRLADPQREVECVVQSGLTAMGDEHLLGLVLRNLLGNAWKFTAKKAGARIEFGAVRENGTRTFYVRDNGAGFDMAYKDNLFKPFQRLHLAADYAGTGIGLVTVMHIVERHDGRVWAEGKKGEGAVFNFTIRE